MIAKSCRDAVNMEFKGNGGKMVILMDPINELNAIILNNKIPNALLFTGNCCQDKKKAAMVFVKTINCLNIEHSSECLPCNICRSCIKIDAAMHPDIIRVTPEPEKSVIKISQIRELCAATASKPHEAKMRMVMVEDAHTMNQEAANSLLKILEEPPGRTFFILLARELNDLLPTIISRCQHLRFRPLSQNEVVQRLVRQWNIHPSVATIAAKSSNGDMEKAMMLANVNSHNANNNNLNNNADRNLQNKKKFDKTDWIKRRQWLLNQLIMLVKPNQNSGLKFLYALILAEKLSKETQLLQDSLALINLCLRDMALVKYDRSRSQEDISNANCVVTPNNTSNHVVNSDHLVNSDFVNAMSEISDRLPENYCFMALEAIHKVETKLQTNASVRLILEQFFLTLIPVSC